MSDHASKEEADVAMECEGAGAEDPKRSKSGQLQHTVEDGSSACAREPAHGRPALVGGAETQHAAIVKVYYPDGAEGKHKVNDAVEFVAVLCLDPEGAVFPCQAVPGILSAQDLEQARNEEMGAGLNAPTSVLPRLHALLHRPLSPSWNPALQALPAGEQAARRAATSERAGEVREAVVGALRAALGGDALAAEYCLLHALSRVNTRPHNLPVGKLSLALAGFPHAPGGAAASSAARPLLETLQQLLPAVGYMPMSTKSLGAALMIPRKDYDTEILHTGALQLAPGTQVRSQHCVVLALSKSRF